jgi:hypothetical protein
MFIASNGYLRDNYQRYIERDRVVAYLGYLGQIVTRLKRPMRTEAEGAEAIVK